MEVYQQNDLKRIPASDLAMLLKANPSTRQNLRRDMKPYLERLAQTHV